MLRLRVAATLLAVSAVTVTAVVVAVPSSGQAASAASEASEASQANGAAGQSCAATKLSTAQWYYNWYVDPGCDAPGFVPMVSGKDKQNPGDIAWQADRAYSNGFRTVLGFNEPNQQGQSVMSVDKALQLWPSLTAHDDVKVGSPAVSGGQGGHQWMESFMKGAADKHLRIDFVAAHFYGWDAGTCTTSNLRSYLDWIKGVSGGRPIWVTEFGCLNASNTDTETVRQFYDGAVKVMQDMGIERWSWYTPEKNHALVQDDRLTSLGEDFVRNSGGQPGAANPAGPPPGPTDPASGTPSTGHLPATEDFPHLYCYVNAAKGNNPERLHLTEPAVTIVPGSRGTTYELTYRVISETWDASRKAYRPDTVRSYTARRNLDSNISQNPDAICARVTGDHQHGVRA